MKRSLKNKLLVYVFLAILMAGFSASVIVFILTEKDIVNIGKDNLKHIISETADGVGNIFVNSDSLVKTIARQDIVIDYLSSVAEPQDKEILNFLKRYNIADQYSAIYLINRDGDTLVSTDESFVGKNYGFRDYFQKALAGESYMDMSIGVTSGKPGYYFSCPVVSPKDGIIGVMVIKLIPEQINRALSLDILSDEGRLMFVDNKGVILYSNDESAIYKSLGKLSQTELEEIYEKKKFADKKIEPLAYDLAEAIVKDYKNVEIIEMFDPLDNEREIIAVSRINDFPFFLIMEEGVERFSQQALKISLILSLFVLLAAVLAALAIYLFISRALKPISQLKDFADKIGQGELGGELEIRTGDELEDFGEVFNEMAKKIKISKEDVEKKIIARTEDLEKLNRHMVGRELVMLQLKKEISALKKLVNK